MSDGLRITLAGATGTLGSEVLSALEDDRFPVAELRAVAGARSLGSEVEFRGEAIPVEIEAGQLRGMDLLIVCTPSHAALELIRLALRAEVACIDGSGSLIDSNEVPLVVADLGAHDQVSGAPLISTPSGHAIAWALVLSALEREAGLVRVVGTTLHSASSAGRQGIELLSEQTLALLNQQPMPDSELFASPIAFDCLPHPCAAEGVGTKDGAAALEARLTSALRRLLGPDVGLAVSAVQVPTFAGEASTLSITTARPLTLERAAQLLESTLGVELRAETDASSSRGSVGRDVVSVARLRRDPSAGAADCGLLLWLAADPVRLAAVNTVKVARARFSLD